jgi:hypothetical protein
MFTIVGAMAELESSRISERVTAEMNAARVRGKRIGRPPLAPPVVTGIEALVATTGLSIRQIQREVGGAPAEESLVRSRSASRPISRMPCDLFFARMFNLPHNISLSDVYMADEMFLTGTVNQIVPIIEIDGRCIGGGQPGPVTTRLLDRYLKLACEDSASVG